MSFFKSLFGSPTPTKVETVPDHIWMTANAKFTGIAKEVTERSKSETVAIFLVAHFPDVLAQLSEIDSRQTDGVPVMVVLASNLSTDIASNLNIAESEIMDLIVCERHLLPSVDDGLEQFAHKLPCRCRVSHHLSLEDPVLKLFAGEWVHNVLGQLGMKEHEAIESPLVSRQIRTAQRKSESHALGNKDADSAADWLEKNFPKPKK